MMMMKKNENSYHFREKQTEKSKGREKYPNEAPKQYAYLACCAEFPHMPLEQALRTKGNRLSELCLL